MRAGVILISILSGFWGVSVFPSSAAQSGQTPDFSEVYQLVRTNIAGISQAEFNQAALQGFLSGMDGRVALVSNDQQPEETINALIKTEVFSGGIAYLRIGYVNRSLADELRQALQLLSSTNKLLGVVLDLRFAGGQDYQAAADVADIFVKKAQPLLIWGDEKASSTGGAAISVPAAALVNRQTSGSAEALAAVLRAAGAALLLGSQTAGHAVIMREFELQSGQRLRIATDPVRLGDGDALPSAGIKPDITVIVSPENERAYYADAFKLIPGTNLVAGAATNRLTRRPRFGEAELVREMREGLSLQEDESPSEQQPDVPVIYDPALARAIDVLKGLAVIRRSKS